MTVSEVYRQFSFGKMQRLHPFSLYKIIALIIGSIQGWSDGEKCNEGIFKIYKNGIELLKFPDYFFMRGLKYS